MLAEFVQIVGLLAAFSSERNASESAELGEFLIWLTDHNHAEIRVLLEQNQLTSVSIKALLNEGMGGIQKRLDQISGQLATLASHTSSFDGLARQFATSVLSSQAVELLEIMENNDAEYFLHQPAVVGADFLIYLPGPTHLPTEPRFLRDDLEMLVTFGLLKPAHNKKGDVLYYATRAGSKLIQERK